MSRTYDESEEDGFCEDCGVSMDLHPCNGGDEWECNVARQKADTMARFFGIFAR